MRVRLISIDGTIAECEVEGNPPAIVFTHRVFTASVQVGMWIHYREVKAERVREIHVFTSSNPHNNNGEKNGKQETRTDEQ